MIKKILTLVFIIFSVGIILLTIYNVDTTKADTVTLANTVISKWETNGSSTSWNANASGIYKTNDHEYRYVGANVDNWVSFNNDMYRIIGVFDSNSTGIDDNLVKLVRDKRLISTSWGAYNDTTNYTTYSNYNSDWSRPSNLNILLNTYFFDPDSTSSYGTCENLTYFGSNNSYKTLDCSKIKKYGIQTQELRNYIQQVKWYLFGASSSLSKQDWYKCERNDLSNCYSQSTGDYFVVSLSNIGLMYVSDYLYASGYFSSSDITSSSSSLYGNQNWLYNGYEWTITPDKTTDKSFCVYDNSSVSSYGSIYSYGVRPSFYLKSSVYVTGGNGSYLDPYTISCDDCDAS